MWIIYVIGAKRATRGVLEVKRITNNPSWKRITAREWIFTMGYRFTNNQFVVVSKFWTTFGFYSISFPLFTPFLLLRLFPVPWWFPNAFCYLSVWLLPVTTDTVLDLGGCAIFVGFSDGWKSITCTLQPWYPIYKNVQIPFLTPDSFTSSR